MAMGRDQIGNLANHKQMNEQMPEKAPTLMERLQKQLAFHQGQVTRIEGLIADYTPEFEAYMQRLEQKL